jgi:DNA (cytosine-5)-methyltransferase 1
MSQPKLSAISLFSSGGIGDLAVRAAGFRILVSNEKLAERHAVFERNFPDAVSVTGDVNRELETVELETRRMLQGRPLTLLYATPPCQGMSKNGRGKLLNGVRAGRKPSFDERNRLIIPTVELVRRLRPEIVIFENVPEMSDTMILSDTGEPINVISYVQRQLANEYVGCAEVVEFADYGVPQCRQRLITVFSRTNTMREWLSRHGSFLPERTHSSTGRAGTKKWVSVREVINSLPPLDASSEQTARSGIPFHRVPLLDQMKYWWVKNTPAERSAFDNQCVECGSTRNPTHSARRDESGINRTSRQTPLYCIECGSLLPRPSVPGDDKRILMKGYTSAYKRMSFDKPASALTRNLSYACSDNKLHPTQNRVLSLYEAFRIHTLDQFDYEWARNDGKKVSDKTIREIIGESIPPAGFKTILDHVVQIYLGEAEPPAASGWLFPEAATGILSPSLR